MPATAQLQEERAELEAILNSGIFQRAPNLSNFLKYVCERYFEGAADQIKEYNIAVEALGRPGSFDQKKDSIVRVEAHRLRKRLNDYYAGPGAGHAMRIVIENGHYAPRFVRQGTLAILAVHAAEAPPDRKHTAIALVAALVLAGVVTAGVLYRQRPVTGPGGDPVSSEFRMLAGYSGPPYTDRQGHKWEPDAYFSGGHSVQLDSAKTIDGLPDPDLPRSMREGDFRYDIPLRTGTYELHLYFSETIRGRVNPSEGDDVRSFRVAMNGETRLDLFDALSEAGAPNRLQVRVFKDATPAKDGKLHLQFSQQSGQPFLNALEILPSAAGRIRPIRIVARKTPFTDADGRVWSGDEYAIGGHLVERRDTVSNAREKNLYVGERFGNFAYHLPVAPGKYRLTLHFAETYFGSSLPNAPPLTKGARRFDVVANGNILLKDFDVGEEAGGANRGIARTFSGLEPNAQGLIVVEFHPNRNYACVNAIELEEVE